MRASPRSENNMESVYTLCTRHAKEEERESASQHAVGQWLKSDGRAGALPVTSGRKYFFVLAVIVLARAPVRTCVEPVC